MPSFKGRVASNLALSMQLRDRYLCSRSHLSMSRSNLCVLLQRVRSSMQLGHLGFHLSLAFVHPCRHVDDMPLTYLGHMLETLPQAHDVRCCRPCQVQPRLSTNWLSGFQALELSNLPGSSKGKSQISPSVLLLSIALKVL